jgi:hypothetical protein
MPDDPKARLVATTMPLRGDQPVAETLPPDETVCDPGLVANARALAAKTIGRFAIQSQLGEGGMGVVLLATDPLLGRKIALKITGDVEGHHDDPRHALSRRGNEPSFDRGHASDRRRADPRGADHRREARTSVIPCMRMMQ